MIQRFDKDNKDTGPLVEWRYGYWVPYHEYEKLEKQLKELIVANTRCLKGINMPRCGSNKSQGDIAGEIRIQRLNDLGIKTDMWMPGCLVYVQKDRTQNIIHFNEWTPEQLRAIANDMEEK
jgi:hypothetical protein